MRMRRSLPAVMRDRTDWKDSLCELANDVSEATRGGRSNDSVGETDACSTTTISTTCWTADVR